MILPSTIIFQSSVVKRNVGVVSLYVGTEGRYCFRNGGLIVRSRWMRTLLSGGVGGVGWARVLGAPLSRLGDT